jgi:hypothetical protein
MYGVHHRLGHLPIGFEPVLAVAVKGVERFGGGIDLAHPFLRHRVGTDVIHLVGGGDVVLGFESHLPDRPDSGAYTHQ